MGGIESGVLDIKVLDGWYRKFLMCFLVGFLGSLDWYFVCYLLNVFVLLLFENMYCFIFFRNDIFNF